MNLTSIKEVQARLDADLKAQCDRPGCEVLHRCDCVTCDNCRVLILAAVPAMLTEIARLQKEICALENAYAYLESQESIR